MASDPSKIAALMSDAIASASASYADGGSVAAWEQEMGRIVARGHMAGWLADWAQLAAAGACSSRSIAAGTASKPPRCQRGLQI